MTTSFVDAVVFNAASSGLGDFVVSSAVTGWQTPASAGAVNGATYRYRAVSLDHTEWEIGTGTYTVSTTTLARTTITASSNAGSKVNFSTAPQVTLTLFSDDVRGFIANNGLFSNTSGTYVLANNGISANSTGVWAVGANGVSVTSSGINVSVGSSSGLISNTTGVWVLAGNGITANSTGTWAKSANGISVTSSGINVLAGNGILANTTGTWAVGANGISVTSSGINVNAGTGIVANTTGTFVDQTVIAPLASPTFTGTPAAPTAANTTSTTQIATTAFVQNVVANTVANYLPLSGGSLTGNLGVKTTASTNTTFIVQSQNAALTNISNGVILGSNTVLANAAGSYTYVGEFQGSVGNTNRLQFAQYRRYANAAGVGWQGSSWRMQYAIDNSFTTGSVAFLELGSNAAGTGYAVLGVNSQETYFSGNGNIGIGNSTPTYRLDVNGTGHFSGDVTLDANLTISGTGTATTASNTTSSTQIATTAFVQNVLGATYTASDVLAKILTVDGSGSGLDADTLDGHDSTYYALSANSSGGGLTFPDTRSTSDNPTSRGKGFFADFKTNATAGLSDGGSFTGVLTIAKWTDTSGGLNAQLGFTDNGNLWMRTATSNTTWGTWYKLWHQNNDGVGSGLDADTLDGHDTSYFANTSAYAALAGNQTFTGGFNLTAYSAGTISSGTFTPNPVNQNYQYYTNNGAHTLAAPSSDCAIDILVTNGASAGSITFSGFSVNSTPGDAYATTNAQKYVISIVRINGSSTYIIKALQ